MFSYIFTFLLGIVGYAVFSALFPNLAGKINYFQSKLITFLKDKFNS